MTTASAKESPVTFSKKYMATGTLRASLPRFEIMMGGAMTRCAQGNQVSRVVVGAVFIYVMNVENLTNSTKLANLIPSQDCVNQGRLLLT